MLAEFAARMQLQRDDFASAWRKSQNARLIASSLTATNDEIETTIGVLLDGLRLASDATSLAVYLNRVAEWGKQAAMKGTAYASTLDRLSEFRRALLPFTLKFYAPGPELQLVLGARCAGTGESRDHRCRVHSSRAGTTCHDGAPARAGQTHRRHWAFAQ